jgi:hypothetical protein
VIIRNPAKKSSKKARKIPSIFISKILKIFHKKLATESSILFPLFEVPLGRAAIYDVGRMVLILEYLIQLRLGLTHIVDDDLAALHVALQFLNQISSKNSRFSRQKLP